MGLKIRKALQIACMLQIIIGMCLLYSACAHKKTIKAKEAPEYSEVDPLLQPYVTEFIELSIQNNIIFSEYVTIGFNGAEKGSIIGTCTYASDFREIDIDINFFNEEPEIRRKALLFHELIHCYCTRKHDFGDEEAYPDVFWSPLIKLINKIPWSIAKQMDGYFEDGCATSIMHPQIQSNYCLEEHWDHYTKEMFERCNPY